MKHLDCIIYTNKTFEEAEALCVNGEIVIKVEFGEDFQEVKHKTVYFRNACDVSFRNTRGCDYRQ